MREITFNKPDDFHIHIRQGADMTNYLLDSSKQFKRGIIMPNTVPPITTVDDVNRYRDEINKIDPNFEPLMTFKILPTTRPEDIIPLKNIGVLAGKYYPAGATTNSEDGITDWKVMMPVLKEMENAGMVLSIHGEIPDSFILDREKDFLPILIEMNRLFPSLKIILEHVSSKEGIECIKSLPNTVAGTISLHHLISTIEDVVNDSNNKCMPVLKLPEDRASIREAAMSGDNNFFFGSDSAPHKSEFKNCAKGKAGVYTAPVLLPKLVELFEEFNALNKLDSFLTIFGADFYGLPYNKESITLIKDTMIVPDQIHGVTPYLAGQEIKWRLK